MAILEFPLWLRATHFLNLLFISLLVRSGFEILSAHPKLYWNDHCAPGTEWLRLVPTSWSVLPCASHALREYLSLHLATTPDHYNPLEQLAYFSVVFPLSPLAIATGGPGCFCGTIGIAAASDRQIMLVYEMNGRLLPVAHGSPLRLRVETQLGVTMVRYIRRIEFVNDYEHIGAGQGGWREDHQFYSQEAGI